MAHQQHRGRPADLEAPMEAPVPAPDDPGGAHAKGFSAEPGSPQHVPADGPLPLAAGPTGAVHVPERDEHVQATGREEAGDYTPNDRLMGSDR